MRNTPVYLLTLELNRGYTVKCIIKPWLSQGKTMTNHNSSLAIFEYNGQVISKKPNGYVNLTQMCQANGKRLDNFMRLKQTCEYIEVLTRSLGCEVMVTTQGGTPELQGTWGHPYLAINLARWISVEFSVWCDTHIFCLMTTGSTSLTPEPAKTTPVIPSRSVLDYVEAVKFLDPEGSDPQLKRLLMDAISDELELQRNVKPLGQLVESKKEYTIVKVRARELGYSLESIGSGSSLGLFVAKRLTPAFTKRIGNYDVKHYLINNELDHVINQYFAQKGIVPNLN